MTTPKGKSANIFFLCTQWFIAVLVQPYIKVKRASQQTREKLDSVHGQRKQARFSDLDIIDLLDYDFVMEDDRFCWIVDVMDR